MQIGCNNSQGRNSQQIEYWFIPDTNESVLLVYFSFAQENVDHHTTAENPKFTIEVLDQAGNPLNLGYYKNPNGTDNMNWPYSRLLISPKKVTEAPYPTATPIPFTPRTCPKNMAQNADFNVEWFEHKPIAFNLTDAARNNQVIRFRVLVRACQYSAHWAYGYFAAKCIPGKIKVDACGGDDIVMTVPWGFDELCEDCYVWKRGTNAQDAQIFDVANVYEVIHPRDPNYPYFRCEMKSYTGVPFVYEANVKYFELFPSFTWKPIYGGCEYKAEFTNTSKISTIVPRTGGGLDTLVQNIENVWWNFGDGTTSTEVTPTHVFNTAGPHTVELVVFDNERTCSSDTFKVTFTFDTNCVTEGIATDTVSDCEENLPYIYKQDVFEEQYKWASSGTYEVRYPDGSFNGCDSVVKVRFDIKVPKVKIQTTDDFCDLFSANLKAVTETDVMHYLWNTGETTDNIVITTPGKYSVEIVDENDCNASNEIIIPACTPYMVLPNSISPSDKNGINDFFYIPQRALIKSLEFSVYNRIGELVYFTVDKNFQWDGKANGKYYFNNVYNYILKVIDFNGISTLYKGSITVL
ncbi:MAG: gliding motility-associated C-terminal domain-containing protein, partial [Bacteroidales bacterium]